MDFDESRLYYSHQQLQPRNGEEGQDDFNLEDEAAVDLKAVRRHFREFLREFFLNKIARMSLELSTESNLCFSWSFFDRQLSFGNSKIRLSRKIATNATASCKRGRNQE